MSAQELCVGLHCPPGAGTELAQLVLRVQEVHLWSFDLDVDELRLNELSSALSATEQERASRFHFARHRNRFCAGRGAMRKILSHYLGVDPATIEFSTSPGGKPALAPQAQSCDLQFNLAHSENLALLGVCAGMRIGVDLERVRFLEDADELVQRFFCPQEAAAYADLPAEDRPEAFFSLWTRKEALLKATGQGIGHCLNKVEVTFLRGVEPKVVQLPAMPEFGKTADWTLASLEPASHFLAAVACDAPIKHLVLQTWE